MPHASTRNIARGKRYRRSCLCDLFHQPARLCLLSTLLFLSSFSARAFDIILDPQIVNKLLADIGSFYQESKTASTPAAQLDALYEMGERSLDLADLMTRDKASHGAVDPSLASLIERRLNEYGIHFTLDSMGYHYDLAAFREYLRRAPNGTRAVDARYVLIGFDQPGDNIPKLQASIAAKERFIRAYPKFSEMSLVKFLLAQQHVHLARLYSAGKKSALSDQQRKIAENLYREIVRLYPNSPEAEPATDYLNEAGAKK